MLNWISFLPHADHYSDDHSICRDPPQNFPDKGCMQQNQSFTGGWVQLFLLLKHVYGHLWPLIHSTAFIEKIMCTVYGTDTVEIKEST